ncbi:MAG: gamma-glutamyl-phosphate reductase, partial [Wenyingzhuangia sp.]
ANAKTRRVSVCNALDCLLIHESQLQHLNSLSSELASKGTTIYADTQSLSHLDNYPKDLLNQAEETHYGTEFLANTMSIKTVSSMEEALNHIAKYSSKHSEAIVSENAETIAKYLNVVDAAAVYANASTAYTDGAQFGLGAEIGISTQKLHARGPMALDEITSYKWVIKGDGQTRS